ncbi:hypothetical protein V8E53_006389 [Lactarius tabidus]
MSTSYPQEVIDDNMNDSNWKKLIDLSKFPHRHYQKALSGATLSEAAFDSINVSAKPDSVLLWTAKEENAQREQGCDIKDMDIYNIKTKQFPSHAEMLLELTDNEMGSSRSKRHATWIGSGIKIQEMQLSLQALVRKIGSHPTADQQIDIALKQGHLQERVDAFQKQAAAILQTAEFDGIDEGEDDDEYSLPAEERDQLHTMVDWPADASVDAEYIPLHLPLHFGHNWCSINAAEDLAEAELQLREGQLNNSLHHI